MRFFGERVEEAKILRPNLCQPKGLRMLLKACGGWGWFLRNQIQYPLPSQCLCLCSSGDRKGPRSHLDSGDTFAGAEPPARSAVPCGEEDTPRAFFSCLCHHDGPREGPWTLRNGRITRTKHHDPFSSFLLPYKRKRMELVLYWGSKGWPSLDLQSHELATKMTVWLKKGFKKGFIKHWWRSPRKNVKFPFLEVSKCKRFSISVRNYKFSTITSSP